MDSSRLGAVALALALGCGAAGCTASSEEVRPPADQIFFPTGVALAPDQGTLFVASANSDLRYDSGTITAFAVAEVAEVVRAWQAVWKTDRTAPMGCAVDENALETLECDEGIFLRDAGGQPRAGAAVRVGNFGAAMAIQDLGDGNARLIVPVRGDPSVTWIGWDGASGTLDCGGGAGFPLCDDAHRLVRLRNDDALPVIADEPYGAYADSAGEFAIVTHLTSGTMSLVDSPREGTPRLVDALSGLFTSDGTGARGASGVDGHGGLVYVTSRTDPRVHMVTIARPPGQVPFLVPSSYFFLRAVGGIGGDSGDSRGIAFGQGGERAYLVVRDPPSVQVYDTSRDPQGVPRNQLLAATDTCRQASTVIAGDLGAAVGERAFVACFQSGELYVIDGRNGARVDSVTTIGRGPYGLALAAREKLLFVSNFLEDSVAVVDADPSSETAYHVILRIGVRP
jgi:DNA-binding beta-propeller fold protein YncE